MDIIQLIINDIKRAPKTFMNLAIAGNPYIELYCPEPLGTIDDDPPYGFTDEVIAEPEAYNWVVGNHIDYCGSIFFKNIRPIIGEGIDALPLIMRFVRAGFVYHSNHTLWSTIKPARQEMEDIIKKVNGSPNLLRKNIALLLQPDSPSLGGRALYGRIMLNYK